MGDDYYLQDFLDQAYLVAKGPDTKWKTEAVKLTQEQYEEIDDKLTQFNTTMKKYLRDKFCEIQTGKKA